MKTVFEWPHQVAADETDELGHANNEAYLRWMNAAAVAHTTALGWPPHAYLNQGQGWVVRRHEIEYLRPAQPGTDLVVRTWVRAIDRATSLRCYAIARRTDQALLARGQTLWAWIHFGTGRPARIPPAVSAAFPVHPEDVFAGRHPAGSDARRS